MFGSDIQDLARKKFFFDLFFLEFYIRKEIRTADESIVTDFYI